MTIATPKSDIARDFGLFSGIKRDNIKRDYPVLEQILSVKEASGNDLSDYQIAVAANVETNARFSLAQGKVLAFWRESADKTWITIDRLPANSKRRIMRWKNDCATSASNGEATFEVFDDFNDNSLAPVWVWEEGVAGNDVVEQKQRLELTVALNSYGHVQRTGLPTDGKFSAQVRMYRVTLAYDETWAPGLAIWFNAYDYAQLKLNGDASGITSYSIVDSVNTIVTTNVGAAETWYWLRIQSDGTNVYWHYSSDGSTWTQVYSRTVPPTWVIDANSLAILGSGFERSPDYPNPDLDNNYTSTGTNWNTYFDDVLVRKYASPSPTVTIIAS